MNILSFDIKQWMEAYKRNSVKPATYDRLVTSYQALLQYHIANIYTECLTTKDIQDYVNDMVENGYALSTIKKQFHLVSAYLKFANTEGIISKPIYNNVKLPSQFSVKKPAKDIVVYSMVEQMKLKKVLNSIARPGYAAALLMLETGLRVGECLALTWDDVLWDRRALRVCKTVIRLANKHRSEVQDSAKSFTSNRTIPLSTTAISLLERLYGSSPNTEGYVFSTEENDYLTYEALRYQIQAACRKAGVPYKGQHVFRHTFATNCYNRGCNVKILSKLLGHSDVSITYNKYIHLYGDALEDMRSVVG